VYLDSWAMNVLYPASRRMTHFAWFQLSHCPYVAVQRKAGEMAHLLSTSRSSSVGAGPPRHPYVSAEPPSLPLLSYLYR
jgi:hypothetical protein